MSKIDSDGISKQNISRIRNSTYTDSLGIIQMIQVNSDASLKDRKIFKMDTISNFSLLETDCQFFFVMAQCH